MNSRPPPTLPQEILRNRLAVVVVRLCITQSVTLLCLGGLWYRHTRKPIGLVVINQDDPFIAERARQFNLPEVVQYYDQVISAIDRYRQDHGSYPPDLPALIPKYLSTVPDIHIRNGERLTYSPEPLTEGDAPFTFYIYGHYPGFAFMHGWMLYYCPTEFEGCNTSGDRHFRQ